MDTYVEWAVFIWAIGIILTLFGVVFNYINQKAKDRQEDIDRHDCEIQEMKTRVEKVEACHVENMVNMAKINKDIEYIKMKQDEIIVILQKK
jgi:hypothetical protein